MSKRRETIRRWIGEAARAAARKRGTFTIEDVTKDVVEQLDARNNPLIKDYFLHVGVEHMLELGKKRDPEKFDELLLAMANYSGLRSEANRNKVRAVLKEVEALAKQQQEEDGEWPASSGDHSKQEE